MIRVIVLTSSPYGTAARSLPTLVASERINVTSVVLAEGVSNTAASRKRKLRKIANIGIFGALNGIRMRSWFRGDSTEHIETLCDMLHVPFYRTGAINSESTVALFKAANADLGLSLGNGYIARRIFSLPRLGMINFHGERLPQYQNAQSVIWPIYNMETTTGLSIHEIDDKIDTGRILYREEYPIEFRRSLKDTVIASTHITAGKAAVAIRHACENFETLSGGASAQLGGKSYTTPSLSAFLRMLRNNRRLYEATRQT